MVVIAGDLTDHKLSFNSQDSKSCINFIERLVKLSQTKNFSIRVIKGTRNHDLDQLNNFLYLQERSDIDFKIINKVTIETLKENKILYLPEEYIEDIDEYYKDYFNQEYDLCFFHGTFAHVEYVSKIIESEKSMLNAPIFSYSTMAEKVRGPIIGGHIHIMQSYKKKVYYTGSFSRWKMSEEKDKGYLIFTYDNTSNDYSVNTVKNTLASKFVTVNLEDLIDIEDLSEKLDESVKAIRSWKDSSNIEHLRIITENSDEEYLTNFNLIRNYFLENNENNIKFSSKNSLSSRTTYIDKQEEENLLEEQYSFIFKKNLDLPKRISKYLVIHDNIKLTEEVIKDLLYSE
jgi:hypothetical protein